MSLKKFSDDCDGCRPAMIDVTTGKALPDDDPIMQAAMIVWDRTTRRERECFHKVTCLNSQVPSDVRIVYSIIQKMQHVAHATALQCDDAMTRH